MRNNLFLEKYVFNKTFYVPVFFLFFLIKSISNLNDQKYFYGDDSWLLLGARFDSIFDSLRCCALSHPIFSLFAQSIFKNLNFSTENTIIFFLIYSYLLALLIFIIPKTLLSDVEKTIVFLLIIASPMFIQYGVRTKPYTTDIAISIITIFLFYKIQLSPKKIYFFTLGFILLISVSAWPLIGAVLLFNFFNYLRKQNYQSLLNVFYSVPGILLTAIQLIRWRDGSMQNFVVAYYAPTEGGIYLFLRWIGYSFIRFFGESNKLDLGFFNMPMSISIFLFLIGALFLFKNNKKFFFLSSLTIFINLIGAILKIWPFGGFRTSIYLLPIFCIFFSKGFTYLISLLKQTYSKELALIPLVILLFLNLQSPNYEQTTRPFDNEKLEQVIYQVDNSNDDILIYHGGLQTIALYSTSHSELEDIGYFEIGMGTEGYHIPIFKKNNLHIGCTRYLGQDNGQECLEENLIFLSEFKGKKINLVGVHIRDHQLIPYLEAFQKSNWNMVSINFLNEVAIIEYQK